MKEIIFFMTALFLLCIILYMTMSYKEEFLDNYCDQYTSCGTCSSASGCSWCPQSKKCLQSTSLKSTDTQCNQMNTIQSSFRCTSDNIPPSQDIKQDRADYALYKNLIAEKVPPPNVYMNEQMEYSPETVMANLNSVRNQLNEYEKMFPDTVASTVQNQIQPIVRSILSNPMQ